MDDGAESRLLLFAIPAYVLLAIAAYAFLRYALRLDSWADIAMLTGIAAGSFELVSDTFASLRRGDFALDYIALLAITLGVATHEYLVAGVIVLMLAGGNTLEKYAMTQARSSLTALADRIPNSVWLFEDGSASRQVPIETVAAGSAILVRKGEVIPLDGTLESDIARTDESSLTGEPYAMEKGRGDSVRSGTVNAGDAIVVRVTRADAESTYRKIIDMVRAAQDERPPIVRIANKYSTVFTLITVAIAGAAYAVSHDPSRVLAVLVIATPCPLILATPIALLGGMNAAARKRIIVKRLASIETLARVDAMVLDKTGTITLGKPSVSAISVKEEGFPDARALAIAEAIERNSLHPLAKAIVAAAREADAPRLRATGIEETVGKGISGVVDGTRYTLAKGEGEGMGMRLSAGKRAIADISFTDAIKEDTPRVVERLRRGGLDISIFTGDKEAAAQEVARALGGGIAIRAECTPQDKQKGITALKARGKTIAMVGDGINDAPALALADVGMVFSHEEHTAASEAADIVFLGGDFASVSDAIAISRRTIRIARESIFIGIGLSVVGMLLAAFGLVPAIVGAGIQEAIDVAAILNALRARG